MGILEIVFWPSGRQSVSVAGQKREVLIEPSETAKAVTKVGPAGSFTGDDSVLTGSGHISSDGRQIPSWCSGINPKPF